VVASTFGAAFDRLEHSVQHEYARRMTLRRKNYCSGLAGNRWWAKVILVGDKPGNGALKLPANHHHTPFYSTKNSSFWLNKQLLDAGIHENDIFWLNAANLHGIPTHPMHLDGWRDAKIVALGGAAETWIKQSGKKVDAKVHHPSAWKRFHSKEAYPLIDLLKQYCST
jgi:hypothetical protein